MVGSQRRQAVRLRLERPGSWDWDVVGCFWGLVFEQLKDCEDDLVGESLAFGELDHWVS